MIERLITDITECGAWLCRENAKSLHVSIQGQIPTQATFDGQATRKAVYRLLHKATGNCHKGAMAMRFSFFRRNDKHSMTITVINLGEKMQGQVHQRMTYAPQQVHPPSDCSASFAVKVPLETPAKVQTKWRDRGEINRPPMGSKEELSGVYNTNVARNELEELVLYADAERTSDIQTWLLQIRLRCQENKATDRLIELVSNALGRLDLEMISFVGRTLLLRMPAASVDTVNNQ